jgi:uncharacterized protein YdiU (UPF0061 family)
VWNLAQLATALIQQMDDKDAASRKRPRSSMPCPTCSRPNGWRGSGAKIGLSREEEGDEALVSDLLTRMQENQADFTNTFRALAYPQARDQFTDPTAFDGWAEGWRARLAREDDPDAVMRAANPWIIPRNHRIEAMIQAAVAGDYAPFEHLMTALATPHAETDGNQDLTRPPKPDEVVPATFCGT